jgi:formylmethanofuran dehydrogenase subunit C
MDPITFGMVSIGMAGGSLCVVSALSWFGIKINEDMIKLALEISKYGGMLYLLKHLSKLFF